MNQTSAALPRGESEFEFAGLEMAPSRLVAPPRVAASPVALECRVIAARSQTRRGATSSPSARSSACTSTSATSSTAASTPRACGRSRAAATAATTRSVTELFEMIRTVNRSVGPTAPRAAWIAPDVVEAAGGARLRRASPARLGRSPAPQPRRGALLFAAALAAAAADAVRRRPGAATTSAVRARVRGRAGDGRCAARAPAAAVLAGLPRWAPAPSARSPSPPARSCPPTLAAVGVAADARARPLAGQRSRSRCALVGLAALGELPLLAVVPLVAAALAARARGRRPPGVQPGRAGGDPRLRGDGADAARRRAVRQPPAGRRHAGDGHRADRNGARRADDRRPPARDASATPSPTT